MTDTAHNRNNSVLTECCLIGILFVLSIRFTSYINLFTLLICSYISIKKSYEAVLCMFMFILSFVFIFKLNVGSGFAFINIVELVFLLRIIFEKDFKFSNTNRAIIIFLGLYLLLVSANNGLKDCIKFVTALFLGAALFNDIRKKISLRRITEYASAGILLSGIIALLNAYFPRLEILIDNSRVKLGQGMYYYRFAGLLENPNFYSVLPSIIIAVYLVLLHNKDFKALDSFYLVINIIFGLMSSSMSFIVCLAITFSLYFAAETISSKKNYLFQLLPFVIVVLAIYLLKDSEFMTSAMTRIERTTDIESGADKITSGRTDIWTMYYDYFSNNVLRLIVGSGLGKNATETIGHQSHNFFIETIFYIGIFGFIMYMLALWKIYGPYRYGVIKISFISTLPFIALLVRGLARCFLTSEFLLFFLIFGALSLWNNSDSEKTEDTKPSDDTVFEKMPKEGI